MVDVRIRYVDGTEVEATAEDWPNLRGDGVDWVVFGSATGTTRFEGRSAYWLYPEGDTWVIGAASFGFDTEWPPEVLFAPDGTQETRTFTYVPDLRHNQLKLGWWWR